MIVGRFEPLDQPLDGLVLFEATTGGEVDLERLGRALVTLIRHRH